MVAPLIWKTFNYSVRLAIHERLPTLTHISHINPAGLIWEMWAKTPFSLTKTPSLSTQPTMSNWQILFFSNLLM